MLILTYSIAQAGVVDESQKLLNQLGYNAGSVDGVYGGKTERALIQFYKDRSRRRKVYSLCGRGSYYIFIVESCGGASLCGENKVCHSP